IDLFFRYSKYAFEFKDTNDERIKIVGITAIGEKLYSSMDLAPNYNLLNTLSEKIHDFNFYYGNSSSKRICKYKSFTKNLTKADNTDFENPYNTFLVYNQHEETSLKLKVPKEYKGLKKILGIK
ncbi:MAG: hypothetical protein AABZ74_07570, partial [Cyanobacteriota bacterium]